MKRPACASIRDGLELATILYSEFQNTVLDKNPVTYHIINAGFYFIKRWEGLRSSIDACMFVWSSLLFGRYEKGYQYENYLGTVQVVQCNHFVRRVGYYGAMIRKPVLERA